MANDVISPPETSSMTDLMRGIITDISALIRQEVRFARTEIKADLCKMREAVAILSLGAVTVVVGGALLALMVVFLLHWLSSPVGTDAGAIPLWACFGIVSAVLIGTGVVVGWMGYKRFDSFNPLPDETAKTVQENVEWIMNSK